MHVGETNCGKATMTGDGIRRQAGKGGQTSQNDTARQWRAVIRS